MMRRYVHIIMVCLFTCPYLSSVYGQEQKDTLAFRIMSYNVENLFDTRHDTLKKDYEFLPDATRHWNETKYWKKLDDIACVITAAGEWTPPALVALCEVENDSVLDDLTLRSSLRASNYRYVMTQSPDERGIDVAMLYQRGVFKLLSANSIPIVAPNKDCRPTRDILHVCGKMLNGDSLDVFVAHFPSRSGGAKQSEPYRLAAARCLKNAVDSLCNIRHLPQIIIMGDFNDYPNNASIKTVLAADIPPIQAEELQANALYHLLARKCTTDKQFGSYKYRGEWGLLDHIILSGNLLRPDAPLHADESKANVLQLPFLLNEDTKYGDKQPFRTYLGPRYQGGYSDHLPVWAELRIIY